MASEDLNSFSIPFGLDAKWQSVTSGIHSVCILHYTSGIDGGDGVTAIDSSLYAQILF